MSKKISLLAISLLLTACGGGGGSSEVPVSTLPISVEQKVAAINESVNNSEVEFEVGDFTQNNKNETVAEKQITKEDGGNSTTSTYLLTLGGGTIEGGLSYTDFGYLKVNRETKDAGGELVDASEENQMIVVQPEEFVYPTENMTFTGKAYANVSGIAGTKMVSGVASLNVNPKQETENLTINFNNWYDMTFSTDSNGHASLKVNEGQNYTDNGFEFENADMGVKLDIGYYGANNKVSEASGEFEASSNNNTIEGVFGAKKQ